MVVFKLNIKIVLLLVFISSSFLWIVFSSHQVVLPAWLQGPMDIFRSGTMEEPLEAPENVYQERRDIARRECSKLSPQYRSRLKQDGIFYDPGTNSLYCSVPKVGSSTWKRLFLIIHKNKTKDPLSISGLKIHSDPDMASLSLPALTERERLEVTNNSFAFMFARDPFHRIFSAYCDKLFMPSHETQNILKKVRKAKVDEDEEGLKQSMTFAESLSYATGSKDPHFQTISSQCNPCAIDFNVIGRMESLDLDTRYVLTKLNRSDLVTTILNDKAHNESHEQKIIEELVQRTFAVLDGIGNVSAKFEAFVKTWKVFHIRGLVRDDIKYPLSEADSEKATASTLALLGVQALYKSGDRAVRLAQREKYYLQAFRSVPLKVMHAFSKYVELDCRLFGFECFPSDLFGGRKHGDEEENIFSNPKLLYDELRADD